MTGEKPITILFADIIFPKDFHKQLDNLKREEDILNFFLKNDFVYCVSAVTQDEKDVDLINERIKKDCMGRVTSGGTLILDSVTIFEQILEIKRKVKQGIPFKRFCHFFIEIACAIQHGGKNGKYLEEKERKKLASSCCYVKRFKEGWINSFSYISTDGRLLDQYFNNISSLAEKRINAFINNKNNNKTKRNPIDSRLRHEVFKRDGYKCLECGATNKEKVLHADHIISVAQGGSDELENLQTLCEDCNLAKSDKSFKGGTKE